MLRTSRLVLTPVRAGDHDELLALWRMPEVCEFLFDGDTVSAAFVTEVIANSEKSFAAANFGLWVLRDSVGGPLFGTAGLRELDGGPDLEVVYSLDPDRWGRGLASEAAAAVLGYGFEVLGLDRVLAEVDVGNVASRAIAERLGMTVFDTVPGVLGPMLHYVRDRD